jgi:hypothetical protein
MFQAANTNHGLSGLSGRQIIHITSASAPSPFLPSTLTCVCNDGTVWTKQEAPIINMFGAFLSNGHSEWTQVSAPPQPIIMQPVMIPQPVVQQTLPIQQYAQNAVPQQMLPQAQVLYPQWQPQPQPTEYREYREQRTSSERDQQQGQQGHTQDRGREQKHAMAGD